MRIAIAAAVVCLSLVGLAAAESVSAGIRRPTNIPAQELASALQALAKERGFQVVFVSNEVERLYTAGANGELTAEEALRQLLLGTGLTYRNLGDDGVSIIPLPAGSAASITDPARGLREGSSAAEIDAASSADARRERSDSWGLRLAQNETGSSAQAVPDSSARQNGAGDSGQQSSDEIIVSGRRQNEQRNSKRNSVQIVDAIGRTAIEENAIRSVADLIRQMPGVMMGGASDHGDSCCQIIRGLGYIQTTMDGRELALAGGRSIELNDVAADVLDGIELYKTPSADMVEGGMAGLVNMRTREPLSYDDFHIQGMLTGTYDSGVGDTRPGGDVIVGDVWDTSIGKFGVIAGFTGLRNSFQASGPSADYRTSTNHFDLNGNGILGDAADAAVVPTDLTTGYQQDGYRERNSYYLRAQWQPSAALEFHGSFMQIEYKDSHYQYIAQGSVPGANDPAFMDDFTLIPGTNIVANGTYGPAGILVGSLTGLHRQDVKQNTLGAKWESGPLKITADVDYTPASFRTHTGIPIFAASTPSMQGFITRDSIDGQFGTLDPTDPTNFAFILFIESWARYESDKLAERLDVAYDLGKGPLKTLQFGTRFTQLEIDQVGGARNASPANSAATAYADKLSVIRGYKSRVDSWFVYDPYKVANWGDTHATLGLAGDPPADPASDFTFDEKTTALYARGLYEFAVGGKTVDGDIGVRAVRTKMNAQGFTIEGSALTPNSQSGTYTNILPSFNLRIRLTDTVNLRFSGSDTVTRPNFGDLSPLLTINPTSGEVTGGNPDLEAFTSRGGDATIEWYHSDAGFLFAALFHKALDGFVESRVTVETIGGISRPVTRPFNSGKGKVNGFEVGANERFVFLPGIWSGFGIDVNGTYLNESELESSTGVVSPILGTPQYMINAGLYFEYNKFYSRVNFNYRGGDSIISVFGPGNTREWGTDLAIVDVSLRYRPNEHWEFMTNLGNVNEVAYPVLWTRPEFGTLRATSYRDYLRIEAGFRAKF